MASLSLQARLVGLAQVVADPPHVHTAAPGGVWGTSTGCYEFIARHVSDDATTLETGLGMSTMMFALWSQRHYCVVGSQEQVDRLQSHAAARGVSLAHVTFAVGTSDVVLPSLELEPVDLFLIDGGHGFPAPVIDWYYGSLSLAPGGIVVIDDIQLPGVHDYLLRFLLRDPRWTKVGGDHKWLAFRKDGDFSVREEWTNQAFLGPSRQSAVTRTKVAAHRVVTSFRGGRPGR